MRSRFYYDGHHEAAATSIKAHLNSMPDFLTPQTANSREPWVTHLNR